MIELNNKRVWVAGHTGMLGQALVRRLASESCDILTVEHTQLDLTDQAATLTWIEANKPDIVFLAAAKVGGIYANSHFPADFIYQNLQIASQVIHACHKVGVEKLLTFASACAYPRLAIQPINETALLTGELEPTNEWYAIAKIATIKLCQAYRQQYGDNFIVAVPTNAYGVGDHFGSKENHVIPALIERFHQAKCNCLPFVELWGSGTPTREFIYVDDLADACVFLMQHYAETSIINIGSGIETSILDLAKTVARVVGYEGNIVLDTSKPDGMPRKVLDSSRLNQLGWRASTDIVNGISKSYAFYQTWLAATDC